MAHKQTGELKKRAWLAKQRLKMGYWDSLEKSGREPSVAVHYAVQSDGPSKTDDAMYKKVCDILDRDETTMNPIGQLIDSSVYDALDPPSKQRYILELSNKFRELKERYYKEKERTGS